MPGQEKMGFWADWGIKILSVLVVPTILWAGTLHAKIAVMSEKIHTQESKLLNLQTSVNRVHENEKTLIRLETEMKNANSKLDDIKRALP